MSTFFAALALKRAQLLSILSLSQIHNSTPLADWWRFSAFTPWHVCLAEGESFKPQGHTLTNYTEEKVSEFSRWDFSDLWRRGSNQPSWHSQWQSRKVSTSPVVMDAPSSRARTKPSLLVARMRRTFRKPAMCFSSGSFRCASGNKTSTQINNTSDKRVRMAAKIALRAVSQYQKNKWNRAKKTITICYQL